MSTNLADANIVIMNARALNGMGPLASVIAAHNVRTVRDFCAGLLPSPIMMKLETFDIALIYVPVKRRATLEQARVDEIAASMLANGQQTPILVREDGARFVLVEGLHRLEAARTLGEATIKGYRVSARKH